MGGSSLAPEVLRRTFGSETLPRPRHDAPAGDPRARGRIDLQRTLFISASKSGSTLETRSHTDYFWKQTGGNGEQWAAITDPGSELGELARERGFAGVFAGEPTIGGRYSALSPFGIVPAALMGVDVARLLDRALEMAEACRLAEGNPGLELGLVARRGLARGARQGPDHPSPGGFGLWAEQLIAESTGKHGKGLVPCPGRDRGRAPTGRRRRCACPSPYELGQEFFRWEFATAVAGSILGHQPVRPARRAGGEGPDERGARLGRRAGRRAGRLGRRALRAGAARATTSASRRSSTRRRRTRRRCSQLAARARAATGCVVTHGFGPRYLHSTGQLHKGGPPTGLFLQVVDDYGRGAADPRPAVRLRAADPRAGRGRLRVAAGARPARRAHPTGGGLDAARNDRPRPHGRQHDEAARGARPRREDVRPRRSSRRRRRSAS